MKKLNEYNVRELNKNEMVNEQGGSIIGLAGLFLASFAIGYAIGRDAKNCECK